MYREEIKEILKNTYDVCARTLDFGSSAASRRKKDEYFFYSLDKDDIAISWPGYVRISVCIDRW